MDNETLKAYLRPWFKAKQYQDIVDFFEDRRIFPYLNVVPKSQMLDFLRFVDFDRYRSVSLPELSKILAYSSEKVQEDPDFITIFSTLLNKYEQNALYSIISYQELLANIKTDGIRVLIELSPIASAEFIEDKWNTWNEI